MQVDEALISYVVRHDALAELQRLGISTDHFVDEYRAVWRFLERSKLEHDAVPSRSVLRTRFPDLELPSVRESDLSLLVTQIKQRQKYRDFLGVLHEAASATTDFEVVDDVIQNMQAELNGLSMRDSTGSHLVNLFDPETTKAMVREMRARRHDRYEDSINTGLTRYDQIGGMQRQKMIVIIGRPGLGKSWLDLLFVAQAVMQGRSVILYPLEMTLYETACRLYTLFTQSMFGPRKVLKNLDLVHGNVNTRKVVRLLHMLEDQLPGTLHVADVAQLADPYTNERIEAEVELYQPDMFWVDYLTLLRAPKDVQGDDWMAVRRLSNGIKGAAMRRGVVGGCSAQVNREAMRVSTFLPRLEHIAYGDSIGQDADQVFSINRSSGVPPGSKKKNVRPKGLYYSLVKNRGGPEIGATRVSWNPNEGLFQELSSEDEDDD